MLAWIYAFVFTQLVEVPVYVRFLGRDLSPSRRIFQAFSLSLVTHPFVWFAFPQLGFSTWELQVAVSEAFAVLVEAAMLVGMGLHGKRAFLLALLANGLSLGLGLTSRALFGVP